MPARHAPLFVVTATVALLTGCASEGTLIAPEVPPSLQAPAGQRLYLEALASGVQIYECAARKDAPAGYEWAFRAPEAALVDRAGRSLGQHFAGPTWQAPDGSSVVGEVKARDPGPDPSAIPWLLLAAKSNTGSGNFSSATSVQRVRTVGGNPPATPCTAAAVGQTARVPYSATYYFYRAAP